MGEDCWSGPSLVAGGVISLAAEGVLAAASFVSRLDAERLQSEMKTIYSCIQLYNILPRLTSVLGQLL